LFLRTDVTVLFFAGNDAIHSLTKTDQELRVDMTDFDVIETYSDTMYSTFKGIEKVSFTPPFIRRARYFRANLSEDCYAPSRVLQD
jgi:hypothetical protein